MKSNVCKIEKGTKDLAAILKESEKVAVYNDLDKKQTMHLRLLCEELDGMLPEIVGDFDGDLWFEFEDGVCKLNVSVDISDISLSEKEQLIAIAKNKRNASASGIIGKIRSALENFFLDDVIAEAFAMSPASYYNAAGYYEGLDCAYYWSLDHYRSTVKSEDKNEAWDELEKSVIATVADDVIVGVKGKHADIIIIKKFA